MSQKYNAFPSARAYPIRSILPGPSSGESTSFPTIPIRDVRAVREEILPDRLLVPFVIDAVPAPFFADVRAVHFRAVGHHVLVHHAAEERVFP